MEGRREAPPAIIDGLKIDTSLLPSVPFLGTKTLRDKRSRPRYAKYGGAESSAAAVPPS
jgi:hypothetical protein